MKIIRSLNDFEHLQVGPVRELIGEALTMLQEFGPYRPELGWFLVAEPEDHPEHPEDWPCPPLLLDADGLTWGDPEYYSPFEFCIRHECGVFELVRILSDAGEAVAIYVPDRPDSPPALLQLCRSLATPP